jgi:cytochrome b involved in lipid metabolism
MGNNTKPQITIDGIEYDIEKFDEQQRGLLDHVVDLERKVNSARFNLDQLSVGRDTFLGLLKNTLVDRPAAEEVTDAQTVQ